MGTVLSSGQDEKRQSHFFDSFKQKVPRIRLIFCTSVIGIGFNSPSINCIIHTKPPRNLSDFVQDIGRDGKEKKKYDNDINFLKLIPLIFIFEVYLGFVVFSIPVS